MTKTDTMESNGLTNEMIQTMAQEFVLQYYTVMGRCPFNLHRFYKDDSNMIHNNLKVTGQTAIHNAIMELGLNNCKAVVLSLDALRSHEKSVLIQVTGEISNDNSPLRRFMQSFVLVEVDSKTFYIMNDIFRYQDHAFCDATVEEAVIEHQTAEMKTVPVSQVADGQEAELNNSQPQEFNRWTEEDITAAQPQLHEDHSYERVCPPEEEKHGDLYKNEPTADQEVAHDAVSETEVPAESHVVENGTTDGADLTETKLVDQDGEVADVKPSEPPQPRSWANILVSNGGKPMAPVAPQPQVPAKRFTQQVQPTYEHQKTAEHTQDYGDDGIMAEKVKLNKQNMGDQDGFKKSGPVQNSISGLSGVPDNCQVFVGNLTQNMKEQDLVEFFNRFGQVVDVKINKSRNSGSNKILPNFGFVGFTSSEHVQDLLNRKPVLFNGHRLNVEEKKAAAFGGGNMDRRSNGGPGFNGRPNNRYNQVAFNGNRRQ